MKKKENIPEQSQSQPGKQSKMNPEPEIIKDTYIGSKKLQGKVALITGGDSGIGRSVAVHFAREGAKIAIVYLNEDEDAKDTAHMVESENVECLIIAGDLRKIEFCQRVVADCIKKFGQLDILVNNAATQFPKDNLEDIDDSQLLTQVSHAVNTRVYEL